MRIESIYSPEFRRYGKIVEGYDFTEFVQVLKRTPCPQDSVIYKPSEDRLEALPAAKELQSRFYGGMPIQVGYCNGYNGALNCLEYHRDSEINIFATDAVLLVALEWEIENGKIHTGCVKAFHAPAGAAVELFATTLHCAPCSPDPDSRFQVSIILPLGTNTDKPEIEAKSSEDQLLWARNNWPLAHPQSPEAREGCPSFFQALVNGGCCTAGDIQCTSDGFFAVTKSIADILIGQGITTFPNAQDQERECDRFFDDWYLYAVPQNAGHVYGLFKMREQECDADSNAPADGDTPGVTISFIAFDTASMASCLADPTPSNRKALNKEINRVVADRGQTHHSALKNYFNCAKADGPYLIAELYVRHIASFAQNGYIAVPKHYAALYQKSISAKASRKKTRLPRFLASNNEAAGYTVCDHEKIYIRNPSCLSIYEKQAILATHTANVSFPSFAAEVHYHARFLVWYAKIPIPVIGRSVYASAIRADMTIDDTELEGPAPFYRLDSNWVKQQRKYHKGY